MGAVTAVHEYNYEGDRLTTNALLMTLIKRLDRQEKKCCKFKKKWTKQQHLAPVAVDGHLFVLQDIMMCP